MATIRRILVPIDFSEPSRLAFEYAFALARPLGAEVDVLHVWEGPTFIAPGTGFAVQSQADSFVELARKAAEDALADFVAKAEQRGLKVSHARAEMGHPSHTITSAAAHGGYDLVVLGTHGRTGISRALIGSVAERVVRHSPCAVLTVQSPSRPANP